MDFFDIPVWHYLLLALFSYCLLLLLLRRRLVGIFDPLHLSIAFISMPLAVGVLLGHYHSQGGNVLYGMNWLAILVTTGVIAHEPLPVSPKYAIAKEGLRDNPAAQLAVLGICFVIIGNFYINVMGSGYQVGVDSDVMKGAVSQNNRGLFLLSLHLTPILFGLVYIFWGTSAGYIALLTMAIAALSDFMGGQKGGIATFFIGLFYIRYLQAIDNSNSVKPKVSLRDILGVGFIILLVCISVAAIRGSSNGGLDTLRRLLLGFDQIIPIIVFDFPVKAYHSLDMIQLNFNTILKAMHMYTLDYNSIGHFIGVKVLGLPPEYDGLLPNSNAAAEAAFSLGPFLGSLCIVLISWINAKLYLYFFRSRYESMAKTVFFLSFLGAPFDFLINGGAHTARLYLLFFALIPLILWESYQRHSQNLSLQCSVQGDG